MLSVSVSTVFLLFAGDPWDTFRRTLSGRFYVPHFITDAAADLIFKLLQVREGVLLVASLNQLVCLVGNQSSRSVMMET